MKRITPLSYRSGSHCLNGNNNHQYFTVISPVVINKNSLNKTCHLYAAQRSAQ